MLPPIRPRCRCTIEYREVEPPKLTLPQRNGSVGTRGLAAGNINVSTTEGSPPKLIGHLEELTPEAVQKTLEHYEAQIVTGSVEHAIIITPAAKEDEYTFSNDDIGNFEYFAMARLRGIDEKFVYELNRNPDDLDFEELNFGELLKLLFGEVKDSHRFVGVTAKNKDFGYKRWLR